MSYVAGLGVMAAAIFKLKQVKDNPTQIPVSTPVALFVCATLLMLLPSVISTSGETIFGNPLRSAYAINGSSVDDIANTNTDSVLPDNLLDRV